jgi:hypothetical protein
MLLRSQIRDRGEDYRITLEDASLMDADRAEEIRRALQLPKPVQFGKSKSQLTDTPEDVMKREGYKEQERKRSSFLQDPMVQALMTTFNGTLLTVS